MMTKFQKTQLFYQIVRGALNPEDVSYSLKVGDILRKSGLLSQSVAKIRSQDGGEALFNGRTFNYSHNLDFYSSCPPQSLGRIFYDHLVLNNLDPSKLDPVQIDDDESYLENLIRQVHDIWHIVTDFDTSISGEIGLQAFKAKQMNWPFSMVALGGASFITLLKTPSMIEEYIDQIGRGQLLGKQMKPLILVDWNQHWSKPLKDVKEDLWLEKPLFSTLDREEIHQRPLN